MDLDDLDIFSRFSTGTFALVSGLAIIGIITYMIYVIIPIPDNTVLLFSVLTFVLGILIPVLFFMEDLVGVMDIVGKLLTGITVAVIGWITYHGSTALELNGTDLSLYIVLPAVFTFLTSLILVKGVIISLMEGEGIGGGGWRRERYDDDELSGDEDEDEEFEERYEIEFESHDHAHKENELFPEEKHRW